MSKLIHLKPTLHRSFQRACARYEKLGARIMAVGVNKAPSHLLKQIDHARDRMYDLAGRCHAVECAVDHAVNPEPVHLGDLLSPDEFTKSLLK
ncbi:hypothetical protein [Erythrobacter aureus]|uniref:Uncharacterized protein n=1 Tax=Erythrobacter aureus TaxID=2182384 RepID=A0A345YIT5_9SPHN|nr:hypothetical protein [Erythrobacter aureus]AXK43837.1 hypothetical protein DVR09_15390 [Erythrobacter aureus]